MACILNNILIGMIAYLVLVIVYQYVMGTPKSKKSKLVGGTGDAAAQYCDQATHTCVGCDSSDDCIIGSCDVATHTCIPCSPESDSKCSAAGKKCYDNQCYTCQSDADCGSGKFCSTDGQSCLVCKSDTDCKDPNLSVCMPDGSACVQCLDESKGCSTSMPRIARDVNGKTLTISKLSTATPIKVQGPPPSTVGGCVKIAQAAGGAIAKYTMKTGMTPADCWYYTSTEAAKLKGEIAPSTSSDRIVEITQSLPM